jgi:DNA-binding MarR family transcriptional regulator
MSEKNATGQSQPVKNIDARLITALGKIAEVFRIMLWDQAKETGLSPIQIQILLFIRHHKEHLRRVVHVAHEFNLTKATISDSVKTLEDKGLITKIPDPQDARSQILKLTIKGNKLAMELSKFAEPLMTQIKNLDTDSKSDYYHSTLLILNGLVKEGLINQQRMCFSCSYYEPGKNGGFCTFLKTNLSPGELKIDCPAYQEKAA